MKSSGREAMRWPQATFSLLLGAMLALSVLPMSRTAASELNPASTADLVRSELFLAQTSLLSGDQQAAADHIAAASSSARSLAEAYGPDSGYAEQIDAGLTMATDAATNGDQARLAFARSMVWTGILGGSLEQVVAYAAEGDVDNATAWLHVREFRQSTRLERVSTGATDALIQLNDGAITTDAAVDLIRADLLDTYQSRMSAAISEIESSYENNIGSRVAESAGLVDGYWMMLAPEYDTQFGPGSRTSIDQIAADLQASIESGSFDKTAETAAAFEGAIRNFRAAPLSELEQARRAGQTLLYLSLVGVEYGRGVENGQVIVDIEIEEARAFLDGAMLAFGDLRPTLLDIDESAVANAEGMLNQLSQDIDIAARGGAAVPPDQIDDAIEQATSLFKELFPAEWERAGGDADFDVVVTLLDQMDMAVTAGQYDQADSARLEAYAIFDAGVEKRLLGFNPSLAQEIETLFWQGSGSTDSLLTLIQAEASSKEIHATRVLLDDALNRARLQLGAGVSSRWTVIFNSATIVFREGLEAILILVSLTASMIGANQRFKKPLALGAGAALLASALLFIAARTVLLSFSQYGEKLEAIVSIIAIGVLLLVMNWFFHKVYWTKWIAGHHARRRAIIGGAAGQMLGLVILGFTSVFREGGETVLFLQAMVLDAGTTIVLEGVLIGMVGVAIVGFLVFSMQRKLPHKKMLIVTGILLAAVLVTMVGNTVHVLQVVGWAPISLIDSSQPPYWAGVWLGIYGTWEGILAQIAAFVFVVGSYYLAEFQHSRSVARIEQSSSSQSQLSAS